MNIWCISKYAGPPNYGTASRLFYLTKEFIRLGHKARLFTSDSNHLADFPITTSTYNDEIIAGVPVCWVKTKKYKKTASVARFISWLDFERKLFCMKTCHLERPDVIIISSLSLLTILYGLYLKKKYSSVLVFEVRDIWPLTMTEEAGFSKWHPLVVLLGLLEKLAYRHSDLIVGTMPNLSQHVRYVLGGERDVFCLPLGFDAKSYQVTSLLEENPFDDVFPQDKVVVGYAGSMGVTNALDSFVSSIKALKGAENIHFMLVGSGDLREAYEEELADCTNVTFLPRLKQEKVKYFLAKCDVLYLSTKDSKIWEYGQSMNKVVEYMLAAKPIVASYTGYPSMINEANCGKFVSTRNDQELIAALLSFVELGGSEREKLGKNGRDWIFTRRQYSKLAQKYLDKLAKLTK